MSRKKKKNYASKRRLQARPSVPGGRSSFKAGAGLARWIKLHPANALLVGLLLAISWCYLLYSPSFSGPFIFDDIPNIERNQQIRIDSWSLEKLVAVFTDSLQSRRPVVNFTFALNYWIAGYEVWGYRIFNLGIHVCNGLLVYLLTLATLNTPALRGRYANVEKIAITAAAFFLVHPVATQSVAYVVQRMTSVATLFYLLSLLLYVRWRADGVHPRWLLAGSAVSTLAALGSKEFAVTLPITILLYELYFIRDLKFPPLSKSIPLVIICLSAMALVSYLFLEGGNPVDRILNGYSSRDFTLGERLLTEPRVVVYYLSLFILPYPGRLNLDYDFGLSTALLEPVTTLFSICVLVGLLVAALLVSKNYRLIGFAILWFFITLTVESTFLALEIIYEHRTYLPFVFLFIAVVAGFYRWASGPRIRAVIIGLILMIFSFWTWQRATVWSDPVLLWSDVVAKSPDKARSHNNLGAVLRDAGRDPEAIPHFKRAIIIDPDYVNPYQSLGDIYYRLDDPQRALEYFETAVRLAPEDAGGFKNLAVALEDISRYEEAIRYYRKAISLDPRAVQARHYLAVLLFNQGRSIDYAIRLLKEALVLDAGNAEIRENLVEILERSGRRAEAEALIR